MDHAAAGSQFIPKLTGGVKRRLKIFGPIQVETAAKIREQLKTIFRPVETFFIGPKAYHVGRAGAK
jgi:hypothetical protein